MLIQNPMARPTTDKVPYDYSDMLHRVALRMNAFVTAYRSPDFNRFHPSINALHLATTSQYCPDYDNDDVWEDIFAQAATGKKNRFSEDYNDAVDAYHKRPHGHWRY